MMCIYDKKNMYLRHIKRLARDCRFSRKKYLKTNAAKNNNKLLYGF